jgi:hypothetical protein
MISVFGTYEAEDKRTKFFFRIPEGKRPYERTGR